METALDKANDIILRDAVGADLDRLCELYSLHENLLFSEQYSDDDAGEFSYDVEKNVVDTLQSMIAGRCMREHGYYRTDETGFFRWEQER